MSLVRAPSSNSGLCIVVLDECLAFYFFCTVWPELQVYVHIVQDAHDSNLGAKA